jgi:hypothetical protein
VKPAFWQRRGTGPEGGLSLFLAMYLLGLVGVLLGIHMLQPAWGGRGSASRSTLYQQKAAKQATTWRQEPVEQ